MNIPASTNSFRRSVGDCGLLRVAAFLAVAGFLTSLAGAATLTWDGSGNGTNPNTSGTWDTTNTNWNNGAATWNNSNNDIAVFGTGASTPTGAKAITLGTDVTAGGITFAAPGGFTIGGSNTLTLAGATPTVSLAVNGTINAVVAGTNGLSVIGTASGKTLTLGGLNTYTGVTTIGDGSNTPTLSVNTLADGGSASSIGRSASAAANLVLRNGGTLNYTGSATSTDRLFTANGTNVTVKNNGTGTLNFTNTGDLVIATGGATTINLGGAGDGILSAAIGNPSTSTTKITKTDAGTWALNGSNSYTGTVTINGGTLSANTLANAGSNSSLGAGASTSTVIQINGGTLKYTGAATSTDRLFTVAVNGATLDASGTGAVNFTNAGALGLGVTSGARTLTLTGLNTGDNTLAASYADHASGGASALVKSGAGKWILSGAHTYTGSTIVNAGTLVVSGSLAGSTTVAVNNTGSILELGGDNALNSATTLSLNDGTFDVNGKAQTTGTLISLSGSSEILLGETTANLVFADSSSFEGDWTGALTIQDWNAAAFGAAGNNHLFFGSSASGLTLGQLAAISFLNPVINGSTQTGTFAATLLDTGELVAVVPEPSTASSIFAGLVLLVGIQAWLRRRVRPVI